MKQDNLQNMVNDIIDGLMDLETQTCVCVVDEYVQGLETV